LSKSVSSDDLDNVLDYLGPTPPIGHLPARGERFWVDRPEQLAHAVILLAQAHMIAVDAEFIQTRVRSQNDAHTTVPRLALLQLAIDGHCFVVDALRLADLSPLQRVLGNPAIAILLHGAGADLHVMAERELYVVHYYDLEATCRSIFGQRESSLAAMLQRAFAFHLDKSLQRTDWTRRPLPQAMIAYAARDAEVTLALYYWLDQYYQPILRLHENTTQPDTVATWIEPFLHGNPPISPEMAVAEAKAQGIIRNKAQVGAECRAALKVVKHPLRRSRLLRLIADLSLHQLVPDILPLLQAATSDERASSVRALGRLNAQSARDAISVLLQDPVADVRRAAQAALRTLSTKESGHTHPSGHPRQSHAPTGKTVKNTPAPQEEEPTLETESAWKSRLRSIMDA